LAGDDDAERERRLRAEVLSLALDALSALSRERERRHVRRWLTVDRLVFFAALVTLIGVWLLWLLGLLVAARWLWRQI